MPPKAFKPPRPTNKASPSIKKSTKGASKAGRPSTSKPTKASTSKTTCSKNRTSTSSLSHGLLPSLSPDSSPNASPNQEVDLTASPEPSIADDDEEAAENDDNQEGSRKARIPPDLLMTILKEFYKEENTKMNDGAGKAVGRYMETFVREAIARAAYGRREEMGGTGEGGGWLEVEDLEKLAPQLILDF